MKEGKKNGNPTANHLHFSSVSEQFTEFKKIRSIMLKQTKRLI